MFCKSGPREDSPVLDRLAPLRRFHDSDAGYKYPDLLTYKVTTSCDWQVIDVQVEQ